MNVFDNAETKKDIHGHICQMNHLDEPFRGEAQEALQGAAAGAGPDDRKRAVRHLADQYMAAAIPHYAMNASLAGAATADDSPRPADQLVFDEQKAFMGNATVTYSHTVHGIPVWESGMVVQIEEAPMQVIGSQSTFSRELKVEPPRADADYRSDRVDEETLARLLNAHGNARITINEKKEFIYHYLEKHRIRVPHDQAEGTAFHLPPVAEGIEKGTARVVAAVQFSNNTDQAVEENWLALIDCETGSVLHLRSLAGCGVQSCLHEDEPSEDETPVPDEYVDNAAGELDGTQAASQPSTVFFDIGETLGRVQLDGNGDLASIRVFSDVLEILKELQENQIRIGIISDPGPFDTGLILSLLQDEGVMKFVDRAIVLFGRKDSTVIFDDAANAAGVSAGSCVFVGESSSERGFASQAGFTVVAAPRDVFGVTQPNASIAWVYLCDPVTKAGTSGPLPNGSTQQLNSHRDLVTLRGLNAPPQGAAQQLKGEYIEMKNIDVPNPAIPTSPLPGDFRFDVNSNDFGAVNAYYNCDRLFRILEDYGLNVPAYFHRSNFPMRVDHRVRYRRFGVLTPNVVNASAPGTREVRPRPDGFRFALAARNTSVGMATAWRVVLHEFGHMLLWNHIGWPNFDFAHSAGDALAAILNDAGNQAGRSETFPWVPIGRSHQRDANQLAWYGPAFEPFVNGGVDEAGYVAEQMLSSTMFRIYQAAGGDSPDVFSQRLAASYVSFLIVKAIGMMSFGNNLSQPEGFADILIQADSGTFQFEGSPVQIGVLRKAIRWGFEMQGAYRQRSNPPTNQIGSPPDVDVFVNDGRDGEYFFTSIWNNAPDIWNRQAADNGTVNQPAVRGQVNFAYVRVSNRGLATANNLEVDAFQSDVSTGQVWPRSWQPLTTDSLNGPALPSGSETIIGPFLWTPESDSPTLLMSVSATGDRSSIGRFSTANPIDNSRLVPFDNNIAQRTLSSTSHPFVAPAA